MREDFERARQEMEREVLLRHGDRERELLQLKSEVLRQQEEREDASI